MDGQEFLLYIWLPSRPFAAPVAASGTGICKVRLFTGHQRTPPEYQIGLGLSRRILDLAPQVVQHLGARGVSHVMIDEVHE